MSDLSLHDTTLLCRFSAASGRLLDSLKKSPLRKKSKTYAVIRKAVNKATPLVQRAFIRAVIATQKGVDAPALRKAYASGDIEGAVKAIPWDSIGEPIIREQLVPALSEAMASVAVAEAKTHGFDGFSIVDPKPAEFIARYGADKVVEISDGVRLGLRKTLSLARETGMPATQVASQILPQIGLHEAWTEAVHAYRDKLTLDSDLTERAVDREVARYANQLRLTRALNIARTESAFASAAGQRQAWDAMAEDGFIDRAVARRQWIESSNPCPQICEGMDGQTVGLDEPFTGGDGSSIDDVPAHPGCACSSSLLPEGE